MDFIRFLVFPIALLLGAQGSLAQDAAADAFSREALEGRLAAAAQLEARLETISEDGGDARELQLFQTSATELRKVARGCIDRRTVTLNRVAADLEKLGEPTEGEERAVTDARDKLNDEKAALEQGVATCRLLLVKAETLLDTVDRDLLDFQRRQLTARFPGALGVLTAPPEALAGMQVLVRHHEHDLAWPRLGNRWRLGFGAVVIAGLLLIPLVRRLFRQPPVPPPGEEEFTRAVTFAFIRAMGRYGGPTVAIAALAAFWAVVSWHQRVLVPELGMSLSGLVLLLAVLAGRTFLSPLAPARYYLPFDEGNSRRFWVAVRLLAVVWTSASFLYFATFIEWSPAIALHLRFAYTVLFALALGRVVWVFFELSPRLGFRLVRVVVLLVLAVAVAAEFIGYRNLSAFLLQGVILSVAAIAFAWLASKLIGDFLGSLEEGRYGWQKQFHAWLGIPEDGYLSGVFWFRLLTTLGIWIVALWAFVRIWGVPESVRNDVVNFVVEGFQVGEVTVVPARIVVAVVLLALLFSGISWFRKQLDEKWLSRSRADVGARNAVSTIGSYIVATVAILLALSVAGFNLGNLAIIVGALSVGIGFGLQNVVNNFVSGLILLFERPIRQGDWVVVGTTEGYVRKISVRSTQIQTFDNADVIVPNSELIANQVTNWMLRDRKGRVRVPVGVAYGTDVQRVKEILLGIALAHPQTVVDGTNPKPRALFMGFGASSLDFELRFFIRNVDERLNVLSDTNFEIDKALRAAGITIPFPQTDVHLHYVPGSTGRPESPVAGEEGGEGFDEELDGDVEAGRGPGSGAPGP